MIKKGIELYQKHKEIINYLIVGGMTTVVALITYYITINLILPDKSALNIQIANVISWIFAVAFAYVANKVFVFESKTKGKNTINEIFKFVNARIFTLLVDMAIMFVFVTLLYFSDTIMKLIVQVVVTILNYVLSKLLVFKNKKTNNLHNKFLF